MHYKNASEELDARKEELVTAAKERISRGESLPDEFPTAREELLARGADRIARKEIDALQA